SKGNPPVASPPGTLGAGTVTFNQTGDVTTGGNQSTGIFAQSDGGTGAGAAVGVTLMGSSTTFGTDADGIFAQSKGGTGAAGVTVLQDHTGGHSDVFTKGANSVGIFAQSDGGAGSSGPVQVTLDGSLQTLGLNAD